MIPELAFGLGAALIWGVADFSTKYAVRKGGVFNTAFYSHVFAALFCGLFLLIFSPFSISWTAISYCILVGMVWGSGNLTFAKAMKEGAISVVTSINASYALYVVFLSVLWFGERLAFYQMVLVFVVIAGVMLASVKFSELRKKRSRLVSGALWSFASAALFGVGIYFFKPLSQEMGPASALFFIYLGATILTFVWWFFERPSRPSKSGIGWAAWIALLYLGANLIYTTGVSQYLASLIAPISSVFPLVAIGLAYYFEKERLELNQWAGVLCVVAGTALLSV